MATQILAVASGAANSADVTVAASSTLTVCLKGSAGPALPSDGRVNVLLKDDAGAYFVVDEMSINRPALVLATGTYRFTRVANGASVGAFSA